MTDPLFIAKEGYVTIRTPLGTPESRSPFLSAMRMNDIGSYDEDTTSDPQLHPITANWDMEICVPEEYESDIDEGNVDNITLKLRRFLLAGIPFAYYATRGKNLTQIR